MPEAPRSQRTLFTGVLLLVAVVWGLAWWLVEEPQGWERFEGAGQAIVQPDLVGPATTQVPLPPKAATPLSSVTPMPVESDEGAGEQPLILWPSEARCQQVTVIGQVVDELGQPVATARVFLVPDAGTVLAWRSELPYLPVRGSGWASLDALHRTVHSVPVDTDGRFSVTQWWAPGTARKAVSFAPNPPALVVDAHGYGPLHRILEEFREKSRGSGLGYDGFGPSAATLDLDVGQIPMHVGARVFGRVVDALGSPLAGVDVTLSHEGKVNSLVETPGGLPRGLRLPLVATELFEVVTDPEGRFEFQSIVAAPVKLKLSSAGWLSATVDGLAVDGLAVDGLAVDGVSPRDLGDLVLPRGRVISGKVMDEQGHPLAGAEVRRSVHGFHKHAYKVSIHRQWQEVTRGVNMGEFQVGIEEARYGWTLTDALGRFTLGGLKKEVEEICVAAPGYEPQVFGEVLVDRGELECRLVKQGQLLLRCVDQVTGEALAVQGFSARRRMGALSLEWGPELPFERGRALGEFLIEFVCDEDVLLRLKTDSHGNQSFVIPGLPPGSDVGSREVTVPGPAAIAGRVVDSAGEPLSGVKVSANRDRSEGWSDDLIEQAPQVTKTDARGLFLLEGLEPRPWGLLVSLPDYIAERRAITAVSGDNTLTEDVQLYRDCALFGLVLNHDGNPVQGANVTLAKEIDGAHAFAKGETRNDGRFLLERLSPGEYTLSVTVGGSWRSASPLLKRVLTLTPEELDEHLFTLPEEALITGRVTWNGQPVPSAQISFRGSPVKGSTLTNLAGQFTLALPATSEGRLTATHSERGGTAWVPVTAVAGGATVADLSFGDHSFIVRVNDALSGEPVVGAEVKFLPLGDGAASNRRWISLKRGTGGDGTVSAHSLYPGGWEISVTDDRFLESAPLHVELVENTLPVEVVSFALERGAALSGVVRTASGGTPNQQVWVHVLRVGDTPDYDHWLSAKAMKGGHFAFPGLLPGDYDVFVRQYSSTWRGAAALEGAASESLASGRVSLSPRQELVWDAWLPEGEL